MQHSRRQAGATLVEVLMAIALAGLMLPTFAEAVLVSQGSRPTAIRRLQATSLEREALEAVRVAREAGWSNVATDGTYHPVITGNSWALSTGSEIINDLTRQLTITSVQRDATGAIAANGGTVDPSTKHITVTISWTQPYNGSLSSDTYLARWQNNTAWTQTTQADFSAGTLTNTIVTNTSGGEVQLNSSTNGTYESPTFDAGAAVSFNALSFTATQPAGTSVTFQIATNNDNATWNYIGPDGTAGTQYTSAGAIPLATAAGRYLRYKATLAGPDSSTTPVIADVTVNYSR